MHNYHTTLLFFPLVGNNRRKLSGIHVYQLCSQMLWLGSWTAEQLWLVGSGG